MGTVGPTPILADHQLDLMYTTSGLTHRLQMRCNAEGSGSGALVDLHGVGTISPADAIAQVVALLQPIYSSSTTFDTWILQKYDGGMYIPVASGTVGAAGSNSGGAAITSQATFFFRDGLYKAVKVILMENASIGAPFHGGYASIGATQQALVDSWTTWTDGNVGSWFCGRSGTAIANFTMLTGSLNRKLRRARGLV